MEKEPKDINNDLLDNSTKSKTFSSIGVYNQIEKINLNDFKENEIYDKKDDFSNDITISTSKNLVHKSLDILNKNEIIYIIKKILSCCLSNFFSSLKYRARREFGLDLRYICSKK